MVNFSIRKVFAAMIDDKNDIPAEPALTTDEVSYPSESKAQDEFEEEVETLNSDRELEVVDDPMAGAFDLDGGDRFESFENEDPQTTVRNTVDSPKEFFNSEIVYRYDIIPPEDLKAIKGDYRIELRGAEGGVWSFNVADQLTVSNTHLEADTVLIMTQRDFMDIVNGVLNPQLALLSKKIEIKGNPEMAMRVQDLLAPRVD